MTDIGCHLYTVGKFIHVGLVGAFEKAPCMYMICSLEWVKLCFI